jgi:nucleotide-binding universal stress UspA family protein
MFRNILVSVDGSPSSDRALAEAIDLAESERARLTILTAVPNPAGWATIPSTAAAAGSLMSDLERETEQILKRAADRVPAGIPLTTICTHEPIRTALSHHTTGDKHDLLVMGSRGRGAITASLLGSVSHYALHHSKIPVLVVHADCEATAAAAPGEERPRPDLQLVAR